VCEKTADPGPLGAEAEGLAVVTCVRRTDFVVDPI
jgi:hypothetical protein